MKKIYLLIVAMVVASAAFAQEATESAPVLKSKKGELYLPVADEWGLGVSATPFLDYLGNFLNGNTSKNNSPSFDFPENPTNTFGVLGKLMVDENFAYRVRFNVSHNTIINKAVELKDEFNSNPDFPSFVEDWQKVKTTAILIAPGFEKRRGSTRLQGVYGAELLIGFNSRKIAYEYGNAISADFPSPSTTDFWYTGYGNNILGNGTRVKEDKSGTNWLFGARGFAGVEYFIAPKISLGGEFGYIIGFETQRKGLLTLESYEAANAQPRETKIDKFENGGITSFGLGLENLSGSINLLFYF